MFFIPISDSTWVNIEDISAVVANISGIPAVHLKNGMTVQARMFPRPVAEQKSDDVVEDFFAYVAENMETAQGLTA